MISLFLVLGHSVWAQAEVRGPAAVEEVYLAKDDGYGNAGEQVTEFATGDVPIYCVVRLGSAVSALVKMNFVAVRVSGVIPETKVVTASYATKEGQDRVNFTGRPDGKWIPGTYRVDLFVDGKMVRNVTFDIKGPAGAASAKYFVPAVSRKPKPKRPPRN